MSMDLAHSQEVTLAILVYIAIGNVSLGFPSESSTAPPSSSPTIIAAVVASASPLQNVTLPISSYVGDGDGHVDGVTETA